MKKLVLLLAAFMLLALPSFSDNAVSRLVPNGRVSQSEQELTSTVNSPQLLTNLKVTEVDHKTDTGSIPGVVVYGYYVTAHDSRTQYKLVSACFVTSATAPEGFKTFCNRLFVPRAGFAYKAIISRDSAVFLSPKAHRLDQDAVTYDIDSEQAIKIHLLNLE